MPARPNYGRGIDVVADLRITIDDRAIDVTADGSSVRAEIGNLAAGRPTLRFALSGLSLARRVSRALDGAALTVVLTREGRPVAELGANVRGGVLARLLRIPNVRLIRAERRS